MIRTLLFVLLLSFVYADINSSPQCANFESLVYRTYDGSCNNLDFPDSGRSGIFFSRGPEGFEYKDGKSIPVDNRPNPRIVSNAISRDDPNENDPIPHSIFSTIFGQFVNHDLENNRLVDAGNTSVFHVEMVVTQLDDGICAVFANLTARNLTLINGCMPPLNQTAKIRMKKSDGGFDSDGVFQITNDHTAWLDLSHVYGPVASTAAKLRENVGGRLKVGSYFKTYAASAFRGFPATLKTINFTLTNGLPNINQTGASFDPLLTLPPSPADLKFQRVFTAGDDRVGENPGLSMMHTLFLREHNRLANALALANPSWNDEKLFQEARRINIAQYQSIVLHQYVPSEFGQYFYDTYIGKYNGYDNECEELFATPTLFAAAAFRYGHSSFRNYCPINQCGITTLMNQNVTSNMTLLNAGFTGGGIFPVDGVAQAGSYEHVIRGIITARQEPMDVQINDVLRTISFKTPVAGGSDIFSLDMMRARLNGVPNYHTIRKAWLPRRHSNIGKPSIYGTSGCPASYEHGSHANDDDPIACFNYLAIGNSSLATSLKSLYKKVNRIDALVGLLIEKHVNDQKYNHGHSATSFGPTLGRIIAEHYADLRNKDRFWFENECQPHSFTKDQIEVLQGITMGELLSRNFDLPQVPSNPFFSFQFTC